MSSPVPAPRSDAIPITRAEWATDRLRAAILFAELKPGEAIPEVRLARDWGVSATPLREAMRRLAAEGLVELRSQMVPRVAPLSVEEQVEVYSLRLVVEPLALRMAMAHRPDTWVDENLALLEAIRAAELRRPFDPRVYEEAHRAFHRSLVADCGSTVLLDCLEGLWDRSMRARYASSLDVETGDLYDSHRVLHEAARDGDPGHACDTLDRHIMLVLTELFTRDELDTVWTMRAQLAGFARELSKDGHVKPASR